MGILARFKEIMEANINALLDKCENNPKMIDQLLRDLDEQLAEVKKETAGVMAEQTRCKRILDEKIAKTQEWDGYARKALKAGQEDHAREFLAKKQEALEQQNQAQEAYDAATQNAEKIRQMHDKLAKQRETARNEAATIKAKMATAKTQETINKAINSSKMDSTLGAFARMKENADKRLDAAMAEQELSEAPKDEAERLAEQYKDGGSAAVDDELERMKAEMGIS